jgi:hypothetical protein
MPLWLVSTSVMLTQYLMAAQQSAAFGSVAANDSFLFVGEMTKIMLIPISVQFAVALRGMGFGPNNQAHRGMQKLVAVFGRTER